MGEKVAILDAGSQYTKVIDRTVRELNVESDILDIDTKTEDLKEYKAIIISGGPSSVYGDDAPNINEEIFELDKPILGICYGLQITNYHFGGKIEALEKKEYGTTIVHVDTSSELYKGLDEEQQVYMSHGDSVSELAEGFKAIAKSEHDIIASISNADKKIYCVQYHPEVIHTVNGKQIMNNFLFNIAGLRGDYTQENRIELAVNKIKETVGTKKVLVMVSGGVDSSVTAALLLKALNPDQVYGVHINNGFMRKDESQLVLESLKALGLQHIEFVDASQKFYDGTTKIDGKETEKLKEAVHSETKRKIIGDVFMHVADGAIKSLSLLYDCFLAQGTLRPDLIESAGHVSKTAQTIKTHHNDSAFVREKRENGLIVEPLADYHKYEVRQIGLELGLPEELIWRQPFPGPGTSIRIICSQQPDYTEDDKSKKLVEDIANKYGFRAVILPIRTVGVQGDGRTYSNAAALIGDMDWEKMRKCAVEITTNTKAVNRVVYVLNDIKEETGITPTFLTEDVIELHREIDNEVSVILKEYGLDRKIDQMPVVLFPCDFGVEGARSIALRPVQTPDFMTINPSIIGKDIPAECLNKIVEKIKEFKEISCICYDITDKPPATTEWE